MKSKYKFLIFFVMFGLLSTPITPLHGQMSEDNLLFFDQGLTYLNQGSFDQERLTRMRLMHIPLSAGSENDTTFGPQTVIPDSTVSLNETNHTVNIMKRRRNSEHELQAPLIIIPIN